MKEFTVRSIGYVENKFDEQTNNLTIKAEESVIHVYEEFVEGLLTIETMDYIDIVFIFHKSNGNSLNGITKSGNKRGVFASRLPHRPNLVGVTTAKLVRRDGNKLIVTGLDALNGSPVIDIKSGDTSMFASEADENLCHNAILRKDPRKEIRNNIAKDQTKVLMMKAAQMHGHYCPGLAMGIMAATYAVNYLKKDSDGMEDLLAITETNNCFSDGVQFVTGCSFGNNALIFKDIGKTAFTLTARDGEAVRIIARNDARETIRKRFPEHNELYKRVVAEKDHDPEMIAKYKNEALKRAFGTLEIPFEELFKAEEVKVDIPDYAPSHESFICDKCGEIFMASRLVKSEPGNLCYTCSKINIPELTGDGIHI
jgi:formylmethanofuran dehydrogenase subunit E